MIFTELKDLPQKELISGFKGRFVQSENQTFAFWEIEKGAVLPEHAHVHEQTSMVTKGKFELVVDGVSKIMEEGMVAIIPSNIPHSGKAITDCEITDVFFPIREGYE